MSKREIKIVVGFVVVFAFLLAILAVAGALNTRSIRESQEAERQRRELASEEAFAQAAEKHKNLLAQARVAAETPSKIDEAIALFEEAEKTDSVAGEDRSVYANVLKTRGEEKLEAGRLDEALADLRKAKTLAPNTEGLAPTLEKASKIPIEMPAIWGHRIEPATGQGTRVGILDRASRESVSRGIHGLDLFASFGAASGRAGKDGRASDAAATARESQRVDIDAGGSVIGRRSPTGGRGRKHLEGNALIAEGSPARNRDDAARKRRRKR